MNLLNNPRTSKIAILGFIAVMMLTALFYSVYGLSPQNALTVGQPSPKTFKSPISLNVIDRLQTEREKISARSQVRDIFLSDSRLKDLVTNEIISLNLSPEAQDLLLTKYNNPKGVRQSDINKLINLAVSLSPEQDKRNVRLLLNKRLIATSIIDTKLTESARNAAANTVEPIMQNLKAGEIIANKGEILTQDHMAALQASGLYNIRAEIANRFLKTIISSLLISILLLLPLIYIIMSKIHINPSKAGFLLGLTILGLILQRLVLDFSPYFIFISFIAILVAVLTDEITGVFWAIWLAVVLALLDPSTSIVSLIIALSSAIAATVLAKRFKNRPSLLLASLIAGLIAALSYILLILIYGSNFDIALSYNILIILAANFMAGILALGLLPLAESSFGFHTEYRLIELSDPNSPLLKRLLLEAAGTYQHSLIISNLVGEAVSEIGGNSLLARVGALYHDVGKLKRPRFFIENQKNENPHDHISPHLSYLIITDHVRYGIKLLKKYKLPEVLEQFVNEHHGTTVLSYFYKRALEEGGNSEELNFRYPGPKPRTKETAVLMLADAVESASRSLAEPSQSRIRALIDQIFEARLQDKQLSESPLNFSDLEIIANSFERMLTAILHRRISYPSEEEIKSLEGEENAPRANHAKPAVSGA